MDKIKRLSEMISESSNIVFFGGAGVSTESGIPDYRSSNGLYETVNEYGITPETILSHSFFFGKPDVFYDFYRKYFISDAKPNAAHKALSELEKLGKLRAVITQNIDGLHQAAGSENVVELHGTAKEFYCTACREIPNSAIVIDEIKKGILPTCSHCGALLKPKVVLYEEPLYEGVAESAVEYISKADMLIVGGTSLAVYPAASFIDFFSGKYIVMINKSETSFDSKADLVINAGIGTVFDEVMKNL